MIFCSLAAANSSTWKSRGVNAVELKLSCQWNVAIVARFTHHAFIYSNSLLPIIHFSHLFERNFGFVRWMITNEREIYRECSSPASITTDSWPYHISDCYSVHKEMTDTFVRIRNGCVQFHGMDFCYWFTSYRSNGDTINSSEQKSKASR